MRYSRPEYDEMCFNTNRGEFSQQVEEAFERHLKRMVQANAIKSKEPTDKSKVWNSLRHESLWYGYNEVIL